MCNLNKLRSYAVFIVLHAVAAIMPLHAAAQYHYCSWMRGTVEIPLSERIEADAELQGRMQNSPGNHNIFDEQLLFSFRQWVHYHANERLKFSVSPFAYFKAYSFLLAPGDVSVPLGEEYRFSVAAEIQERLHKALFFNGRVGVEYRSFNDGRDFFRPRFRAGLRYSIDKKYTLGANYELLFQAGTKNDALALDNDRIWVSAMRPFFRNFKAEVGLMRINRSQKNLNARLQEGNLLLNITYVAGGV